MCRESRGTRQRDIAHLQYIGEDLKWAMNGKSGKTVNTVQGSEVDWSWTKLCYFTSTQHPWERERERYCRAMLSCRESRHWCCPAIAHISCYCMKTRSSQWTILVCMNVIQYFSLFCYPETRTWRPSQALALWMFCVSTAYVLHSEVY